MFDPLGEELLDLGFLVSIKMRGLVSVYDVIYKEENISLAILNVKLSKGILHLHNVVRITEVIVKSQSVKPMPTDSLNVTLKNLIWA